jgi:hypothetical protein
MSRNQELYNQLSKKLRALVSIKNSKQITPWIYAQSPCVSARVVPMGNMALPNPGNS